MLFRIKHVTRYAHEPLHRVRKRRAVVQSDNASKRCAIYTRKSSEERLEQNFNSLQAQRQACEAFVKESGRRGLVP